MVAILEVLVSFCIYLFIPQNKFFFTSYASSTISHTFILAFASLLS